jgi:hypothetical protein
MASWQEHLQLIQTRLQQLLKEHDHLKKQHQSQAGKIAGLNQKNLELSQKIEELEQQNLVLKSSATPLDGEEKKLLEKKIDQYLQSIDKCITSLSQ